MKKLAVTFALGAAALLSLGAAIVPATAQAQPSVSIQIGSPPPAPRYERMPPPRRGYVWAPGHYEARGRHYGWVDGRWMRARPGYAYRAPDWRERNGHWEYSRGRWDADRDGVPDRHDRRPNNPHRS